MPPRSVVFGPSGFAPSAMIVGDDHLDVGAYAMAPANVTNFTVDSDTVYEAAPGRWEAQVQLSWSPVEFNQDGSVCDDLAGYELAWKLHASAVWSTAGRIDPLLSSAYLSGFLLNAAVDFRIRAFDTSNNYSGWTELDNHTTSKDTTGPNAPSTPSVTSLFGAIRAQWDGKDSAGAAMPSDFDHITVHWGTTAGFVPSAANQVDVIADRNGGASLIADPDYTTPYYVKFVAYDTYGNPSAAPSAASASVVARQGVDADFANVSVTKLTGGVLSATVGISTGKLQIGVMDANGNLVNPTGARLIFDSSGFKAWNSANVNTVSINSDGSAQFIGTVSASTISGSTITGGIISGATFKAGGVASGLITGATIQNSANLAYRNPGAMYTDLLNTAQPRYWLAQIGSGAVPTTSQATALAPAPPSGAQYAAQGVFFAAAGNTYQRVRYSFRDDYRQVFFAGVTYTLAFDIRTTVGPGGNWTVQFNWTPDFMTPPGTIDNISGVVNVTSAWQRYSITFTPTVNWVMATNEQLALYFVNTTNPTVANTVQITGVQIEVGNAATAFVDPTKSDTHYGLIDGNGDAYLKSCTADSFSTYADGFVGGSSLLYMVVSNNTIDAWNGNTSARAPLLLNSLGGGLTISASGNTVQANGFWSANGTWAFGVAGSVNMNAAPVFVNQDATSHRILVLQGASGNQPSGSSWLDCKNNSGATVAAVTSSGNVQGTGAYTSISDATVKTGINYDHNGSALEAIRRLKPATFEYTEIPGELHLGFVAQDVVDVIPEAVVEWYNGGHAEEIDDLMDKHEPGEARDELVERLRAHLDQPPLLGLRSDAILAKLVLAVQELADQVATLTPSH